MRRRLTAFVLAFVLLATAVLAGGEALAAPQGTQISVAGSVIRFKGQRVPVWIDGHLYAPLDPLAEQTGWSVTTKSVQGQVQATLYQPLSLRTAQLVTGSTVLTVDGEERTLAAPPLLRSRNVYIPVSGFALLMDGRFSNDLQAGTAQIDLPVAQAWTQTGAIAQLAAAPVLDGLALDDAWQQASVQGDFSTVYFNKPAATPTEFRVSRDENALYFLIECTGAPVPLEAVGVFLAPASGITEDTPYYTLTLIPEPENNLGRPGGIVVRYRTGVWTELNAAQYQVAYAIGSESWTAEVRLPFTSLVRQEGDPVPQPAADSEWRFNVVRARPFTEAASSWVPARHSQYQDMYGSSTRYHFELTQAATSGRTGSMYFVQRPVTVMPDGQSGAARVVEAGMAEIVYRGLGIADFVFERRGLNLRSSELQAWWITPDGQQFEAPVLAAMQEKNKGAVRVSHPRLADDGSYRLRLFARHANSGQLTRREFVFDKQHLMAAGAIYNTRFLPVQSAVQTVADLPISDSTQKLIDIIPRDSGFNYVGDPARPTANPSAIYNYNYDANMIVAKVAGAGGIKTSVTRDSVIPAAFKPNRTLTVETPSGQPLTLSYYEDQDGRKFFLDAHLSYQAKEKIRYSVLALANSNPLDAAWLMYNYALAFSDWLPSCDFVWRTYPVQWNWGPPFHHFGGLLTRWHVNDLMSMSAYVNAYGVIKQTNAFDVVSNKVGIDVEKLILNQFFQRNLDVASSFPINNGNTDFNGWIGRIRLGSNLGEPDYYHQVFELMDRFASVSYMLDGFFREVAMGYHAGTVRGANLTIAAMNGWSDPPGYVSPRTGITFNNLDMSQQHPVFKAADLMMSRVIHPNGRYFPIQDTWGATQTPQPADTWELGNLLLPAANLARMSVGSGADTTQLYLTAATKYGHDHADPLSLALYAKGHEILPDLGYTHTYLRRWTMSTLAHNTVTVDSKDGLMTGAGKTGGRMNTFAELGSVQVMQSSQENAYPGLTEYRREPWQIRLPGSTDTYVVDIFRVDGGSRHEYSLGGDALSTDVSLTTDVPLTPYSERLLPPGTVVVLPEVELEYGTAEGHYYGYIYVEDVQKADLNDGQYTATLRAFNNGVEKPGLHITGFAGADSELYVGKSPSLRTTRTLGDGSDKNHLVAGQYTPRLIVRRDGSNLRSDFVHVLEPLAAGADPQLTSIERLETGAPGKVALRITAGQVTDTILSSAEGGVIEVDGIRLEGRMGFVRKVNGVVTEVSAISAASLTVDGTPYAGRQAYSGTVLNTMRKASGSELNAFVVDQMIGQDAVGQTLVVRHPDETVHAFFIASVQADGGQSILEIQEFDPGYEYNTDGTSAMRLFPMTKWTGDHTFRIEMAKMLLP